MFGKRLVSQKADEGQAQSRKYHQSEAAQNEQSHRSPCWLCRAVRAAQSLLFSMRKGPPE
jgi:hypothetical protein